MNLRAYFQKIREAEASISEEVVYVSSLASEEGGMAGILSEVTRLIAAKLLVEQRARLATAEEIAAHLAVHENTRRKMHEDSVSQRLQVAIVSDMQLEALRGGQPTAKKPPTGSNGGVEKTKDSGNQKAKD